MKFVTPIWHPNGARCVSHLFRDIALLWFRAAWLCAVYSDGRVCISILHKPGGTADIPDDTPASECWRPILNIEAIVVSVLSMLSDPNFSSPANMDASVCSSGHRGGFCAPLPPLPPESSALIPPTVLPVLQVQMRDDVDGYTRRVKHLVEESR